MTRKEKNILNDFAIVDLFEKVNVGCNPEIFLNFQVAFAGKFLKRGDLTKPSHEESEQHAEYMHLVTELILNGIMIQGADFIYDLKTQSDTL